MSQVCYLLNLLALDVDFGLELVVVADGVVESDFLVGEHVDPVESVNFSFVLLFLARNHLHDLGFHPIVLFGFLFVLVLQNQVTPRVKKRVSNSARPTYLD